MVHLLSRLGTTFQPLTSAPVLASVPLPVPSRPYQALAVMLAPLGQSRLIFPPEGP